MKANKRSSVGLVKLFRRNVSHLGMIAIVGSLLLFFQNCGQPGQIGLTKEADISLATEVSDVPVNPVTPPPTLQPPNLDVCNGVSCVLTPITTKTAVTTILLALGDELDSQLVINGASSQLIAETVIRYTSPVTNPKILVVRDYSISGESPEDTTYVADVLLKRYNPKFMIESASGLSAQDVAGFDVVWFNNPGHPMSFEATYKTLLSFKGGVVLQGDDLSRGSSFSMEKLTHLKYVDNGASVTCEDGRSYLHDNNTGNQYRVSLDPEKMPEYNAGTAQFLYGNDIDLVSVASNDIEILATALPGPTVCQTKRPVIARYMKEVN